MDQLAGLFSQTNQNLIKELVGRDARSSLIVARSEAELELAKRFFEGACQRSGEHVLVTEPDQTDKIKIEAARQIIEKSITTTSKKRWFFIMRAETMTTSAQNSLLKLLEEPNAGVNLVLFSAQPNKLLTTIKSRTQVLKLQPITKSALQAFLRTNYPKLDDTRLNQLLFLAQDNLKLLFELIEDGELSERYIKIATDARVLIGGDEKQALMTVKNYFGSREDAVILAKIVLKIYQTLTISKATDVHFNKTKKWLTTLTNLNQNCSVKLSLVGAVI